MGGQKASLAECPFLLGNSPWLPALGDRPTPRSGFAGAQALTCQWATREFLINVSEMPFRWKADHEVCANGWGCQDTLILIDNGLQVNIVLTKGCTPVGNQDARITEHRAGPGLAILSYTHVCRHEDNCNSLSTTLPLWALPSTAGPGSLRCPVCLSKQDCESVTKVTCPAGSTHCYRGSIQLRGGGVFTVLRVQGCMSQDGCNVLNGTREIGSIVVSEDCSPNAFLTCEWGSELHTGRNLSRMPMRWTTTRKICDPGEVCEETLLLVEAGQSSVIVGSKGCTKGRPQDAPTVSIHSGPPGVLVASYAHFCSSNGCNRARSTSVLLNSLPRPAAPTPGDLQCPICVQGSAPCPENPENVTCPNGTTHCYGGYIRLYGGGIASKIHIQGCVTEASSSLLNHTQKIGIFSVAENSEEPLEPFLQDGAVPTRLLAWVVGLGLSLALWCGMPLC
ncbi:CD177 antigen isoform X1 [Prionailurus bengalensis]|uniref:CD177 antigen isoform X1 n=1 Tax=Prionailurus bengalensis TaxID=37029 RepID=UPI001CA8049F|nr:CD177 antigen isoform X1 [Prionailurus bengalensis]XP_043454658.1 CD177 antigen isoform X1 [Prionailurus bengalensis]XP_043454659.1 CD177 antigen isoform X1 [Prionailurus bengalensis]XP_043454660.1 CD177 antigen isoform X1 [Prionailurus bengalensis]XP_043454661.1 CD177 antigen isoform X1 [Prionailurus bengalensis]